MGKLAQPKKFSPDEEQRMDSTHADCSGRRPSLKRRVKSQGDIPEPGFPLLPRRRMTGPASATIGRSVGEREATGATRRVFPPGMPRRGAWPLLHDDGGIVTPQDSGNIEKLHGGGGSGCGGGDDGGVRSTANICAIEAMLEEGGGNPTYRATSATCPKRRLCSDHPGPSFPMTNRVVLHLRGVLAGPGKKQKVPGMGSTEITREGPTMTRLRKRLTRSTLQVRTS